MWIELLLLLLLLIILLYRYVTRNFDRFEKLGLPGDKPSFPFGTEADMILRRKHPNDCYEEMYNKFYGEKVVGTFIIGKPVPVLQDPELIKQICVKDFHSFVDRVDPNINDRLFGSASPTDAVWGKQLTALTGDEWKQVSVG